MKNLGKTFEENFRKSVPTEAWYYRFKDSASSYYGGNQGLRFSVSNISDNLIFYNGKLFLNELKNHKGKSIPLSCIEGNKTKQKQIKDLVEASLYDNVECYIIVFFSDVEKCYGLSIASYEEFKRKSDRASIPIQYFEECGIEISTSKLKTNYKYDILGFLKRF